MCLNCYRWVQLLRRAELVQVHPDTLRCAMRKYLKMLGVICITLSHECYMQKKEQSYLQVTMYWYELKEELLKYASGPAHVNVVKEFMLPIFYDVMAIDCATKGLVPGPVAPASTI